MRRLLVVVLMLVFAAAPMVASAGPVPGTYTSAFRGGAVLNGRASVARPTVNSGNPKVFDGQSWDGTALGTQWEIKCGVEATPTAPDSSLFNAVTGTGFITYNQTFTGGTFAIYPDIAVGWGDGTGTLNTTQATSQVYLQSFVPVSSSFTVLTSGTFSNGTCHLDFALSNGYGVGETPYASKPATYPAFLATDCSPADAAHQFGTWADANDIVAQISCTVPTKPSTWGYIKSLYK